MPIDELTAIVRREFIDQVRDLDNPHWKAQTPDYLKEVCAKAGYPNPDEAADFFARAAAQAVRRAVIDECIQAIKSQRTAFASKEYAPGQPDSSFSERFACNRCIEALEELKGETDGAA